MRETNGTLTYKGRRKPSSNVAYNFTGRCMRGLTVTKRLLSSVLLLLIGRWPAAQAPRPLSRAPDSGPIMQLVAPTNCRPLLCAAALALSGCWTAPVANVQPQGEPRLIQGGIAVASVKNPAVVQSVDADTRTLVVRTAGDSATSTYRVSPKVTNFGRIKVGNTVQITVAEELTIYVLRDGKLPGVNRTPETIAANAKVLLVDPTYRLLRLQYPNGKSETFKVDLGVKLKEMEAGDDVVIRSLEVLAVRVHKS